MGNSSDQLLLNALWSKISTHLSGLGLFRLKNVDSNLYNVLETLVPSWQRIKRIFPRLTLVMDRHEVGSDRRKVIVFYRNLLRNINEKLHPLIYHMIAGNQSAVAEILAENPAAIESLRDFSLNPHSLLTRYMSSNKIELPRIEYFLQYVEVNHGSLFDDLFIKDRDFNAMFFATMTGCLNVVKALVKLGMDPCQPFDDFYLDECFELQVTPFHVALANGHQEIVEYIMANYDVLTIPHYWTLFETACEHPSNISLLEFFGSVWKGVSVGTIDYYFEKFIIRWAARSSDVTLVKKMIDVYRSYASQEPTDSMLDGIFIGAMCNKRYGAEIIEFLESTTSFDFAKRCREMPSLIVDPCRFNNIAVARMILAQPGCEVNSLDHYEAHPRTSALDYASAHHDGGELVLLLVENGAQHKQTICNN